MINEKNEDWSALALVVEHNLSEFVEEMRAIDVVDLISFVRMERFPNIEDLVNSSTELFFRAEMLVFAWVAGIDLRWETRPVISLGMEFRHPAVSLFFNLTLGATERGVEILWAAFQEQTIDPVVQLRKAFAEARLPGDGAPLAVSPPRRAGPGRRASLL